MKTQALKIDDKLPMWVRAKDVAHVPLYMRAVKEAGTNMWHVERLSFVNSKWTLFRGTLQLLDWSPVQNYIFYTQEKAEAFIRHIAASNPRTAQRIEGEIHSIKHRQAIAKSKKVRPLDEIEAEPNAGADREPNQ